MTEEQMIQDLNPKNRGLGRGLNALFDDDESKPIPTDENHLSGESEQGGPRKIGIDKIHPNPLQPRNIFNTDGIEELASSIKTYGILQPLLVRSSPEKDGTYEIVAGERRWRAAQRAQLHEIPVLIVEFDNLKSFEVALIENLQREDLDPIDEAAGYQKLREEHGYTQEKLAEKMGKSRSHIANMMRLLDLPAEVQFHLVKSDISIGHARALLAADNPEKLVKTIISQGLSVRQAEKLVAGDNPDRPQKSSGPRARNKPAKDVDTLALEKEVSNTLGMAVTIDSDGKDGTLKIAFKSLDQLDELLHRLSHFPGSRLSG